MADVVRDVEFFDLLGHQRRADLGRRALVVGAYLDTGAGRTIVSSRIADGVRMIDVPSYRIQYTVPINQVASTRMTAMRLRAPGCARRPPVPMLVAVSDEIIDKLELPGVEVLIGQDYMQAARMRIDMAPGKEAEHVECRPPPKGYEKVRYDQAAARTTRAQSARPKTATRSVAREVANCYWTTKQMAIDDGLEPEDAVVSARRNTIDTYVDRGYSHREIVGLLPE